MSALNALNITNVVFYSFYFVVSALLVAGHIKYIGETLPDEKTCCAWYFRQEIIEAQEGWKSPWYKGTHAFLFIILLVAWSLEIVSLTQLPSYLTDVNQPQCQATFAGLFLLVFGMICQVGDVFIMTVVQREIDRELARKKMDSV